MIERLFSKVAYLLQYTEMLATPLLPNPVHIVFSIALQHSTK